MIERHGREDHQLSQTVVSCELADRAAERNGHSPQHADRQPANHPAADLAGAADVIAPRDETSFIVAARCPAR